jgi:hypothetical protein
MTTTSNKSSWWTTQGNVDGSNNSGRDVIAQAVARAGLGQHNESGQGEE